MLWDWDIARKVWWAKPEEPWLSPLCSLPSQGGDAEQSLTPLPSCYSTVCWGHAITFSVPRNERWSTSRAWFAPVPSPSWEQPAKTQPFLYFLRLLWSLSVSRREPKMTCDGLCFVSLNSVFLMWAGLLIILKWSIDKKQGRQQTVLFLSQILLIMSYSVGWLWCARS